MNTTLLYGPKRTNAKEQLSEKELSEKELYEKAKPLLENDRHWPHHKDPRYWNWLVDQNEADQLVANEAQLIAKNVADYWLETHDTLDDGAAWKAVGRLQKWHSWLELTQPISVQLKDHATMLQDREANDKKRELKELHDRYAAYDIPEEKFVEYCEDVFAPVSQLLIHARGQPKVDGEWQESIAAALASSGLVPRPPTHPSSRTVVEEAQRPDPKQQRLSEEQLVKIRDWRVAGVSYEKISKLLAEEKIKLSGESIRQILITKISETN